MAEISLTLPKREVATIHIKGITPLIAHRWSEKARRMMLDAQQGRKAPKQSRDPEADYEASRYRFPDGADGFPVMAFKKATVAGGARAFGKSVKMTELRQHIVFLADGIGTDGTQLMRLITTGPKMREDMVRVGNTTADLRYRPEYTEWAVDLRIEFIPSIIDLGSVVSLVEAGGANGVGEWRPEKNGSYGMYRVTEVETSE